MPIALTDACDGCRWHRSLGGECRHPSPAVETRDGERRCLDFARRKGVDWHALVYGNRDTRWNHV